MISLISPALIIAIPGPPLLRVARATPALERGLALHQPFAQPRQLAVQTSIYQEAADLRDEPAQERPVHDLFEHHLLAAGDPAQPARPRSCASANNAFA